MSPEEVSALLADLRRDRPDITLDLRWRPMATSTMDVAVALAEQGARHGLIIGADEQTAGRGRRGQVWQSPPGAGLYFSMCVRPESDSISPVSSPQI